MVVTSNPSFWVTDEGKLQQTLHKVSVFFLQHTGKKLQRSFFKLDPKLQYKNSQNIRGSTAWLQSSKPNWYRNAKIF